MAAFFAFEDPSPQTEPRTVWALAVNRCRELAAARLPAISGHDLDPDDNILLGRQDLVMRHAVWSDIDRFAAVFPVEPWNLDSRQSGQQTVLLSQGRVDQTFQQTLDALGPCDGLLRKYSLPNRIRLEVLEDLASMNVTAP